MRIFILILSITLKTSVNYCQIRPVLNSGYSALLGYLTNHGYQFQEYQVGIGNRFNERFSVHLNYKYIWYAYNKPTAPSDDRMKSSIVALSLGYRLLKKEHLFSPMIMFDVGTPVYSNGDKSFMHGYTIIPKYEVGAWRYNRGLFFGKLKALCDVQVKDFNLQFGASFNLWYENVSWLIGNEEGYYLVSQTKVAERYNFGLEAGLLYTFPGKKDKHE
jgi:hypothetical protein